MAYFLEIYYPGSLNDVWQTFESPTAFGAISSGDIVNPGIWEGSESPMKVLKVTTVEHLVWRGQGELKHKIMVFTTEVDGTAELRTGG